MNSNPRRLSNEYLELAKIEFGRDRDTWTRLLLERRFWHQDLSLKLAERQFASIVNISAISAALVAIIFSLVKTTTPIRQTALVFLSLNIILGVSLVLYSFYIDKKKIPVHEKEELSVYSKFQEKAVELYGKAYEKTLTDKDVFDYYELRNKIVKEIQKKAEEMDIVGIMRRIFFNMLYFIFIMSFYVGAIGIILSIF